jgi:hypothetical protein
MKTIKSITGNQLREKASLKVNNTNFKQANELFFVQLDDDHAVDNTGAIFQIVDSESANEVSNNSNCLQYESEIGTIYNYAEDTAIFAEGSEDLEIYSNCKEQAELLADEIVKYI